MSCVAFGCKNRAQSKIPGVTFHRFPKNSALQSKWVRNIRRANFAPSKSSTLCSEHFTEDQIDRTSLCCVRLRENAVPTVFNFPPEVQQHLKAKKRRLMRNSKYTHTKLVSPRAPNSGSGESNPDDDIDDISSDLDVHTNVFITRLSVADRTSQSNDDSGSEFLAPDCNPEEMHTSEKLFNNETRLSNKKISATNSSKDVNDMHKLAAHTNRHLATKSYTRLSSKEQEELAYKSLDLPPDEDLTLSEMYYKEKYIALYKQNNELRKQIKTLQQSRRRHDLRIKQLNEVLSNEYDGEEDDPKIIEIVAVTDPELQSAEEDELNCSEIDLYNAENDSSESVIMHSESDYEECDDDDEAR